MSRGSHKPNATFFMNDDELDALDEDEEEEEDEDEEEEEDEE